MSAASEKNNVVNSKRPALGLRGEVQGGAKRKLNAIAPAGKREYTV